MESLIPIDQAMPQPTGAVLTILPHTGHLAHIEATEAWNAALLHFLSQK